MLRSDVMLNGNSQASPLHAFRTPHHGRMSTCPRRVLPCTHATSSSNRHQQLHKCSKPPRRTYTSCNHDMLQHALPHAHSSS